MNFREEINKAIAKRTKKEKYDDIIEIILEELKTEVVKRFDEDMTTDEIMLTGVDVTFLLGGSYIIYYVYDRYDYCQYITPESKANVVFELLYKKLHKEAGYAIKEMEENNSSFAKEYFDKNNYITKPDSKFSHFVVNIKGL